MYGTFEWRYPFQSLVTEQPSTLLPFTFTVPVLQTSIISINGSLSIQCIGTLVWTERTNKFSHITEILKYIVRPQTLTHPKHPTATKGQTISSIFISSMCQKPMYLYSCLNGVLRRAHNISFTRGRKALRQEESEQSPGEFHDHPQVSANVPKLIRR